MTLEGQSPLGDKANHLCTHRILQPLQSHKLHPFERIFPSLEWRLKIRSNSDKLQSL